MLDQQQYYFNRKNETPNESKKISNTFNEYFTNATKNLNLCESTGNINFEIEESCKNIEENLEKYRRTSWK